MKKSYSQLFGELGKAIGSLQNASIDYAEAVKKSKSADDALPTLHDLFRCAREFTRASDEISNKCFAGRVVEGLRQIPKLFLNKWRGYGEK